MALAVTSNPINRALEPRATEIPSSDKRFEATLSQSMARRSTPVQRTQLSTAAASSELRRAWANVTGETPDDKTVALLTAQWAHETGHGASMYNYNFGGIKGTGPTGLSVEQRTKEGWGRNEHQIVDHFRAYESAEAGAADYVKLLTHRFPEATNAARAGDTEGFVRGLKQRGYFTGDARVYERSVTSISNELLATSFQGSQATKTVQGSQATKAVRNPSAEGTQTSAIYYAEHREPTPVESTASARDPLAVLLQPLMPTVLMSALSETPSEDDEPSRLIAGAPIGHISTSSMVDEILRATLQFTSSEGEAARRSGV